MLEWYKDNDITIFFSDTPKVRERFIIPSMDAQTRASVKKYPYMNMRDLTVTIFEHEAHKKHIFTIPKRYAFDGASIPGKIILKILIGASTDNRFLIAAMVHDWMCEHHESVNYNRNLSSKVFKALLLVGGTPKFKAQLMYLAVDVFQRTQGWQKPQVKDDENGNEIG